MFMLEGSQGYQSGGTASCGHMNIIEHGHYHTTVSSTDAADTFLAVTGHADTGGNGHGRAPISDCMPQNTGLDSEGHALGGAFRAAVYAQFPVATCLHEKQSAATTSSCSPPPPPPGYALDNENAADWVFAGCYISNGDGTSHGDPWSDGSTWKDLDWESCRQLTVSEGHSMFVMENPMGYAEPGHASCGHMEQIMHGNYQGGNVGNGNGRAPDSDCGTQVDQAHHYLGGPYRFAVYAPTAVAACLTADGTGSGAAGAQGTQAVSDCATDPPTEGSGGTSWIMVGCFVSDADGSSHADPWADGTRWVESTWSDCRAKAVGEGVSLFVMEGPQIHGPDGTASCGHMEIIEHGNYRGDPGGAFVDVTGYQNQGQNGHGRAPDTDCMVEIDSEGHPLGGAFRFAAYAQYDVAVCLNNQDTATDPNSDVAMFSGAFTETFATAQLGAGTNIVQLVETGDKGPALDFIEITASDGSHAASRRGRVHITSDNGYVLFVNGEKIGTGGAALPRTDPAHTEDGWVKTDFYQFEASCEIPTAFAIEGVDDGGVAAVLAEIEHCGETTATSDSWKCGAASATTSTQTRPNTRMDNLLQCGDGSECLAEEAGAAQNGQFSEQMGVDPLGWGCCNDRGGRAMCPPNVPILCARPNSCGGGGSNCCGNDPVDCVGQDGMVRHYGSQLQSPMDNPYCSCKLTRRLPGRPQLHRGRAGALVGRRPAVLHDPPLRPRLDPQRGGADPGERRVPPAGAHRRTADQLVH